MSRRIKFHTFQVLFRFFAHLADKSGGWWVFVRPKLLLGSLIVGLGLSGSMQMDAQNQAKKEPTLPQIFKSVPNNSDNELTEPMVMNKPYQDSTIFMVVEQMPQFPGGKDSLFNFISKNLRYPNTDVNVQGRVICRFVVDINGSVIWPEILRSLDPACDKEAVRVIKSLPKFIPGKQNGKNVRVWYTMPVIFKLE